MDLKYDIMKHPNICLTTDGGAQPYIHGEDTRSIGQVTFDMDTAGPAGKEVASKKPIHDFILLSGEELDELIEKKERREHERSVQKNQ